jgi:hypothetical protein
MKSEMKRLFLISIFLILLLSKLHAQSNICDRLTALIDNTEDVCLRFPSHNHCNVFVGMAIKDIYGFDDFLNKKGPSGYFIANEIVDLLFTELSEKWESLGTCDNQNVLDKAQLIANSNHAVVAVWKNPDKKKPGHVALVLPGLQQSGWSGMMVPNAANFAQAKDPTNFICSRLSGAFSLDKKSAIYIFARK